MSPYSLYACHKSGTCYAVVVVDLYLSFMFFVYWIIMNKSVYFLVSNILQFFISAPNKTDYVGLFLLRPERWHSIAYVISFFLMDSCLSCNLTKASHFHVGKVCVWSRDIFTTHLHDEAIWHCFADIMLTS